MQDLSHWQQKSNGRWTKEEHLKFLEGLRIFGKNWKKIEQLVSTRNGTQIRSHAQKFFLKCRQSAADQPNEFSQMCSDLGDDHQEATLNSKTSSPTPTHHDDSHFLNIIIQYSNGKDCFDFWKSLIDFPHPNPNPSPITKQHHTSFTPFTLCNPTALITSTALLK